MQGLLILDKPEGRTSFDMVHFLRKLTDVRKIGHTGTLDPLATGVMVMLIGQEYTRRAPDFAADTKEYEATFELGLDTDTYDITGNVVQRSSHVPTPAEITSVLLHFQGILQQVPPMYSAKKIGGKRLYDLARKNVTVARNPVPVEVTTKLIRYHYPRLELALHVSKGTYIRSIAHDMGALLGCFATLSSLRRTRSGRFTLKESIPLDRLTASNIEAYLCTQ
ncbi:MAG: tRNA pseudouridine(55) synthase TruB [Chlamydiae bacterium RIFCSPHIGHO2_12_FULL_49_11]|nr:MAG: tRNA pseudouridine(55) synthase TruB [Chlamydiae bacterium RIFCSPHIGHO2_12_FULL_49_11]